MKLVQSFNVVINMSTTHCQRCDSCNIPVLLMFLMERSTICRVSGKVQKQISQCGSFIFRIKLWSQGLKSGEYDGWRSTSLPNDGTDQPQGVPCLFCMVCSFPTCLNTTLTSSSCCTPMGTLNYQPTNFPVHVCVNMATTHLFRPVTSGGQWFEI